jgi:enoyl-CoA hydratase
VGTRVSYQLENSVATITLDDGKVNAMSPGMQAEIHVALDRAATDRAVVVVTGRTGVFSAGFDLGILRAGGSASASMVQGGFELAERILAFPRPVIMACTGHAIAMGAFLLLSGDYLIGAAGDYKLTANEVAIGLTIPRAAVEILRRRLAPAAFSRAITLAEPFGPGNAVEAGFLDRVSEGAELSAAARAIALPSAALDPGAHAASKLRARQPALTALRAAIEADADEYSRRYEAAPAGA